MQLLGGIESYLVENYPRWEREEDVEWCTIVTKFFVVALEILDRVKHSLRWHYMQLRAVIGLAVWLSLSLPHSVAHLSR